MAEAMATTGEDFNDGIEQETTPNAWVGKVEIKPKNLTNKASGSALFRYVCPTISQLRT